MGKAGEGGCTCLHSNCTPGERLCKWSKVTGHVIHLFSQSHNTHTQTSPLHTSPTHLHTLTGSEVHTVDVRERLLTAATESSEHDQVLCTGKEQAAVARYPHIKKHNKIFIC